MHQQSEQNPSTTPLTACWNAIGVHGDQSCPELSTHVHCRNCPVYSSGAADLLDRPVSVESTADRAHHFGTPKAGAHGDTYSVVIFRIGLEWFALPTAVIAEVAERRVIHSVPHRRSGNVLGVANVRGELLVCVSLGHLLGVESSSGAESDGHTRGHVRLLVVRGCGVRAVLPVDDVWGIRRVPSRALRDVPSTVSKASTSYSKAVMSWDGHVVGLLDEQRLLRTLNRSLG